jgi:hypothetical protein
MDSDDLPLQIMAGVKRISDRQEEQACLIAQLQSPSTLPKAKRSKAQHMIKQLSQEEKDVLKELKMHIMTTIDEPEMRLVLE